MSLELVATAAAISLSVLVFLLLLVGVVLIVVGTITKNRFGINFRPPVCQSCGNPGPDARVPKNLRQTLWGGWTCDYCDTECDKWGRPVED